MNSNDLLSFIQKLTGVQQPEVTYPQDEDSEDYMEQGQGYSPNGADSSQNPPQGGLDLNALGKYRQPFDELVASGMPPEEAYATLMQQMEADQSQFSEYTPQEQPLEHLQPRPKANFGVYGRTN